MVESTPEVLRFEFALRPRSAIAGNHLHPASEQRITVSAGELHLRIDGRHHVVKPGDSIAVPAGAAHDQWNPGDAEVRAAPRLFQWGLDLLAPLARALGYQQKVRRDVPKRSGGVGS